MLYIPSGLDTYGILLFGENCKNSPVFLCEKLNSKKMPSVATNFSLFDRY